MSIGLLEKNFVLWYLLYLYRQSVIIDRYYILRSNFIISILKTSVLNLFGIINIDQKLSIMKTLKKQFKSVALILSMLILLQGCTVYKSVPVTLEEASKAGTKVNIENKNGENVRFLRVIELNDGHYYGVKKANGLVSNIRIDENKIKKVELKDELLSTISSIAIPVIAATIVFVIAANTHPFPNN